MFKICKALRLPPAETRLTVHRRLQFEVVILTFLEILTFNLDENSFPRVFSMSRTRIFYPFALAITFEGRKANFNVRHFGSK